MPHHLPGPRRTLGLLVLPLLVVGLIACSSGGDDQGGGGGPNPEAAETAASEAVAKTSALCASLRDLDAKLTSLRTLSSSTTVDGARQAARAVSDSLKSVAQAAGDVAAMRFETIKVALDALIASVQNVQPGQPVGAVIAVLSSHVIAIANTASGLKSQSGC